MATLENIIGGNINSWGGVDKNYRPTGISIDRGALSVMDIPIPDLVSRKKASFATITTWTRACASTLLCWTKLTN